MKITRKQMIEIIGNEVRTDKFLHYINEWLDTFKINTPLRVCHYIAQCCHETDGLKYTKELGKTQYFIKYERGKLASQLGNTKLGDGPKYRGRGLIHITGRINYQAYQNSGFCRGDIMNEPQLLEQPLGAVKSSMWWWWKHGCNDIADKDNILALTKKVNGGTNGLESRKEWLAKAKKAFDI